MRGFSFRREVYENDASFLFLIPEDGTDRLSRNVGKKLPLLAAQLTNRAQFSNMQYHRWRPKLYIVHS